MAGKHHSKGHFLLLYSQYILELALHFYLSKEIESVFLLSSESVKYLYFYLSKERAYFRHLWISLTDN